MRILEIAHGFKFIILTIDFKIILVIKLIKKQNKIKLLGSRECPDGPFL